MNNYAEMWIRVIKRVAVDPSFNPSYLVLYVLYACQYVSILGAFQQKIQNIVSILKSLDFFLI